MAKLEKAIIEIIDMRDREPELKEAVKIAEGGGALGGAAANIGGASVNKGLLADYAAFLNGSKGSELTDAYLEKVASKKRMYTVQFNPNSISFSGHSGGMISSMNFNGKSAKEMAYEPAKTTISMSVEFFLDALDPQDAFMEDKANLSLTNIAKGAGTATDLIKGKEKKTSVQREVEGFMGALRNRYTRLVVFNWGNFNYSGVLRSIMAEYTMFNPLGEPVRARMRANIMCVDEELWPNSLAVWQERYKEEFQNGSESFVGASQINGSLINF